MNSTTAIQALQKLKEESSSDAALAGDIDLVRSWRARVRAILVRSLGETNHLISEFDSIRWSPGPSMNSTPPSRYVEVRTAAINAVRSYIDAAIFELDLTTDESDSIVAESFDVGLWSHVSQLVEGEDWANLAASVVIYVEDRVRTWSGLPNSEIGKNLYARALGDEGELRLGAQKGEWEGWRALGMGLAQAVGNVTRHRIEKRSDSRAYALGILGLGSLLLTQIRWQHEDVILQAEEPRG